MSDARQRFLVAILSHIGADRIVEAHLFPAIRQGGVESGLAVVAATVGQEGKDPVAPGPAPAADRCTVFNARYTLMLKGPNRGAWETSIHEEADAPLATIDAVVHGVQRRAGESESPERLSGAEMREALGPSAPTDPQFPASSAVR